jgi:Tol biopolymer transport system component
MTEEGLMAGISEAPDVTVNRVGAERDVATRAPVTGRHAWLSVGIAAWLVGAFYVLLWSVAHDLSPDPALSVYIVPFYLGLAALAAASIALIVRAVKRGRRWRDAFPTGYGVLGVGLTAILAGLIADVGWREGVGQPEGIAGLLAPTRLLIVAGLALVAAAPLRAAFRTIHAAVSGGTPRWAAVLSAAMLLAVLWLPGGFAPAVHLERAKVQPNSEIWLMDADGANQTRLIEAHDGAIAWNPVWSPDGARIAYTRLVLGDHPPVDIPDEADIWIADADGSHAHPLVERPDWQWIPHWSPDGAWIVYTDEPEAGPWADAGPTGLGAGGILGTGFGFGSPDPVRTYADIWRVRADGTGSPERITSDPGDDRAATFSPDGTMLAFDSTRAGGTDVWVMHADGSDPQQLTFDHGFAWGATWSPDGSSIVFNAWRKHEERFNQDLYRIDPDGRNETRLTQNADADVGPSWSPDGTRITFRRISGPIDGGEIWSIDADGNDEQLLSRAPGSADDLTSGGGAWAPDGRIAFMRAENPPADAHPLVREDLATAAMLITVIVLALVAVLLASISPPFGAFTVLIGGPTALISTAGDQVLFIPGAIVGGLIVDILVRFAPDRWKLVAAGAGSAAVYVVNAEVAVAVTSGMGWSASLMAGVVVAVAAVGWGIAEVVRRPESVTPEGSA